MILDNRLYGRYCIDVVCGGVCVCVWQDVDSVQAAVQLWTRPCVESCSKATTTAVFGGLVRPGSELC